MSEPLSGEFEQMMNSGSPMSYESLVDILESLGPNATIRYVSEMECESEIHQAQYRVNFKTDWNCPDEMGRWASAPFDESL